MIVFALLLNPSTTPLEIRGESANQLRIFCSWFRSIFAIFDYRFYISSIKANAKEFAGAVRRHWQIENCLHWCLDVGFNEDKMRIRNDHSPQNLAVLRHMALNILKQEKELKKGLRAKQFLAALDVTYLQKVLFQE